MSVYSLLPVYGDIYGVLALTLMQMPPNNFQAGRNNFAHWNDFMRLRLLISDKAMCSVLEEEEEILLYDVTIMI